MAAKRPSTGVALVENDAAAFDSLRLLLDGRGLGVVGFGSAEDLLSRLPAWQPACVVSGVRLPGLSGLDLMRALRAQGNDSPVILITSHGDIATAVTAMKEGAFDFVEKPYDAEHLVAGIEKALAASEALRSKERRRKQLLKRLAELSPRQKEVAHLVADGLSNKQIAARLGISPRTVENYRAWAMERMGAANVAELVRKVLTIERGE